MRIQAWLHLVRPAAVWAQVADKIAADCFEVVWNRCEALVHTMGRSECRGYVRARAGHLIRPALDAAVQNRPLVSRQSRAELVELTLDRLVVRVLQRCREQRVPATRAWRRAA